MSEKENIVISTREEAFDLIENALKGVNEDRLLDIDIEGDWSKIRILIKGENYQASLNGRLIKALAELQTQLNRIYAHAVYGKSAKALSNEEREEIELTFQISKGSSIIEINLGDWLGKLGEAGLDKMTGTEIVVVVLGLAVIWGGLKAQKVYTDSKQHEKDQEHETARVSKAHEEETKRQELLIEQMAKQNETIQMALKERSQMDNNIIKAAPTAESIDINGHVYDRSDIQDANRSERQSTDPKRLDDLFYVTGIVTKPEGFTVSLVDEEGSSFRAELAKDKLKPAELESLWQALRDDISADLKLIVRIRLGVISSATIIGMNHKS